MATVDDARLRADLRRMATLRMEDTLSSAGVTAADALHRLLIAMCETMLWILKDWPIEGDPALFPSSSTSTSGRENAIARLRSMLQEQRPQRRTWTDALMLVLADSLQLVGEQWPPVASKDSEEARSSDRPGSSLTTDSLLVNSSSLFAPYDVASSEAPSASGVQESPSEAARRADLARLRQLLLLTAQCTSLQSITSADAPVLSEQVQVVESSEDDFITAHVSVKVDADGKLMRKKKRRAFEFYWEERRAGYAKTHVNLGHNDRRAVAQADWRKVTDRTRWQRLADAYNEQMSAHKYSNKPKPPVTANAFFFKEVHHLLRERRPHLKGSDILAEVGKMWERIDDKSKWLKMQADDRRRYEAEVAFYKKRPDAQPSV